MEGSSTSVGQEIVDPLHIADGPRKVRDDIVVSIDSD